MKQWMKDRVQIYDQQRRAWVKYNAKTGAFMQIKKDAEPFRRVPVASLRSGEGGKVGENWRISQTAEPAWC